MQQRIVNYASKSSRLHLFGNAWFEPNPLSFDFMEGTTGQSKKHTIIELPFATRDCKMGSSHAALLSSSAEVYTIGQNNKGQCGVPTSQAILELPEKINFNSNFIVNNNNTVGGAQELAQDGASIEQVACGSDFTMALANDRRTLYASGANDMGQVSQATPLVLFVTNCLCCMLLRI